MRRSTRKAMPKIVEYEPSERIKLRAKYLEKKHLGGERDTKYYHFGGCHIMLTHELTGWHLSISCKNRYPTWDEITHARYTLLPADIMMVMALPPPDQYVNLSPNCFHLSEISKEIMEAWETPVQRRIND